MEYQVKINFTKNILLLNVKKLVGYVTVGNKNIFKSKNNKTIKHVLFILIFKNSKELTWHPSNLTLF